MTTIDKLIEKLEPCPFCGAALAKTGVQVGPGTFGAIWLHPGVLTDTDCPLSGRGFSREKMTNWNTRAPDPALSSLQEQKRKLEEALASAEVIIDYAADRLWSRDARARMRRPACIDVAIRKFRRARALLSGGGEG